MKIFEILKYISATIAIAYLFIDLKIAIVLFLLASIFHVLPIGPNALLSAITGYLMIGGVIYLFINWKVSIALVLSSFLVAKFRLWGNKVNHEYYSKVQREENKLED